MRVLKLRAKDLEPGRYRVVCRVRDTTKVKGDRHPWVLADEHDLLVSERAWWVEVPRVPRGGGAFERGRI